MTKLAILRTAFLGTSWKCQFAEHLTRLQPDLNPDAADEISDAVHRVHGELAPAEAANRFATRQLGSDLSGRSAAAASAVPQGPSVCAGSDRRL